MKLGTILYLGWDLRNLNFTGDGVQVKENSGPYYQTQLIENARIEIGLNGPIKDQIGLIRKKLEKYKDKEDPNDKINLTDANYVKERADSLVDLMYSKLNEMLTFQVIEECCLDKNNLIKLMNGEKSVFFESNIWDNFSEIGKSDFSDAAKCLLIGAPTPATMITMRAAEEILKKYYTHKTGKDPGRKNWGTLTDELKRTPNIDTTLIGHLDYLRTTRRNMAQHPNKIFSQREAERIFMEIIPTIYNIYLDME